MSPLRESALQAGDACGGSGRAVAGRALLGRPRHHACARRAAVGRGLRDAVDARREPGQVASGAHDLVLRDLRARAVTRAAIGPSTLAFACCSTPTTTRSATGTRDPSAACSRARRSTRCSRIAATSSGGHARCSRRPSDRADLAALRRTGLHHEQQHQELILTDVKHLLSRNPLKPAYQKHWPLHARRGARARAGSPSPAGCARSGTPARTSASTTRRRATASGSTRSRSPRIR